MGSLPADDVQLRGRHHPGADKRSADIIALNVPDTECQDHKRND